MYLSRSNDSEETNDVENPSEEKSDEMHAEEEVKENEQQQPHTDPAAIEEVKQTMKTNEPPTDGKEQVKHQAIRPPFAGGIVVDDNELPPPVLYHFWSSFKRNIFFLFLR